MSDIIVRNAPSDIVKSVKLAAIDNDMTVKEWVLKAISKSLGDSKKKTTKMADVNAIEPEVLESEETDFPEPITKCKRCDGEVERDPKNPQYWLCPKGAGRCGRQLDESEVKQAWI